MNFKLLALALLSFTLFSISSAFAQDDESSTDMPGLKSNAVYLGPVFGYNRAMHTADLASFPDSVVKCPTFTNGVANGFHAGIFYEQPFSAASKHSIILRALYSTLPASFTQTGDEYPSLVKDATGAQKIINSVTEHTLDVVYNTLSFDLMYKFKAIKDLVVTVGPTFDLPFTRTLTQKYKIIKPDNAQFSRVDNWEALGYRYEDNDRTIVVFDDQIKESASLRAAIKVGVQYEIMTGKKVDIIPGVFYQYALTKVTSVDDWSVHAVQVGVDIRFAVPSPF